MFDETGSIVWYNNGCGGPKDQVDGEIVCLNSDGMASPATLHSIDTDGNTLMTADGTFNHEARVDPYDSSFPVLTYAGETESGVKTQKVVSWDRTTNTLTYPVSD